jgi:NADP-dependent 3-hydroxy acid dehydrogenase YdfG
VALVTGASSGIGAAIAAALAAEGAPVCLVARRAERLRQVADGISARGGVASVAVADVGDRDQAANAVRYAVATHGRLDIVVQSAGVGYLGPVVGADLDLWHEMVRVNLLGVLNVTHAAVPHLLVQECSDLVVISSHSGRLTVPDNNVYAATKFGVGAFCDSMRQEVATRGLRVSLIEPGMTRGTEITTSRSSPEVQRFILDYLSNRPSLAPGDVAASVVHMVSQPPNVTVAELLILPTASFAPRPPMDGNSLGDRQDSRRMFT